MIYNNKKLSNELKNKFFFVILFILFLIPNLSKAIDLEIPIAGRSSVTDLADYLVLIYNYIIYLAGVFAVIMIIVSGFQWVMAGGNESKISGAKERIKNAIIGLVLVSGSYLILNIINPDLVNIEKLRLDPINPEPIKSLARMTEKERKAMIAIKHKNWLSLVNVGCEFGCSCQPATRWNCKKCDSTMCSACSLNELCLDCENSVTHTSIDISGGEIVADRCFTPCNFDRECPTDKICNTEFPNNDDGSYKNYRCTSVMPDGEGCGRHIECASGTCFKGVGVVFKNTCGKKPEGTVGCAKSAECETNCCCNYLRNSCTTVEYCSRFNRVKCL